MRDAIEAALRGHGADYVEIRIEENRATRVAFRGRELENLGRTANRGGSVRALSGGGWGFASFNTLDGLEHRVADAVAQARLAGGESVRLAPTEAAQETVTPRLQKDPRAVPLAAKMDLLGHYNDRVLSTPGVQSSAINYGDAFKHVTFANSDGAFIEQERVEVTLRVAAVARHEGAVQQSGFSIGRQGDFGFIEDLHGLVAETAERAVDTLRAPTIPGGEYTVVLDPVLAGVFCHEAFGHLSESDFIYENPRMQEVMVLGRRFGLPILNIVDGAAIPGLRGSFRYDDEGVAAQRTDLIRDGILVGRLHSRETAAKLGERPTGNARALDYRFPPIVRMTNTIIEPGTTSFNDLLAGIEDGVYVKNWYGGQTSMEMFTFSAGEAYRIRKGKVAEMVRPVKLSGNIFTTLMNVDAIGNDLDINQGGGCGKGGQSPLPVSNGSPHIRIQRCLVGSG